MLKYDVFTMNFVGLQTKFSKRGDGSKYESIPVGCSVRAVMKIVEGSKTRNQTFEGLLIRKKKINGTSSFTLRKVSFGVGVEKVIPLNMPALVSMEVTAQNHVRRSKLYFLRNLSGKASKLQEIYGARRKDFGYLKEELGLTDEEMAAAKGTVETKATETTQEAANASPAEEKNIEKKIEKKEAKTEETSQVKTSTDDKSS